MIAPDSRYAELSGFQKETGMEPRAIPSSFYESAKRDQ